VQVELTSYASDAADVVNADLSDDVGLAMLLDGRPWLAERAGPADLPKLRRLQHELAGVVDAASAGDDAGTVAQLNRLLEIYPVRPRISGHDASSWHLHVNEDGTSMAGIIAAETVIGLTALVTELGSDRIGRCAAPDCNDAFVDTSTNRSKRFCSTRCATRTNVGTYRQRRRQQTAG
jgi:predicted RNA-binding Zn ribbon-like protein